VVVAELRMPATRPRYATTPNVAPTKGRTDPGLINLRRDGVNVKATPSAEIRWNTLVTAPSAPKTNEATKPAGLTAPDQRLAPARPSTPATRNVKSAPTSTPWKCRPPSSTSDGLFSKGTAGHTPAAVERVEQRAVLFDEPSAERDLGCPRFISAVGIRGGLTRQNDLREGHPDVGLQLVPQVR
jgi:hypothetical protein